MSSPTPDLPTTVEPNSTRQVGPSPGQIQRTPPRVGRILSYTDSWYPEPPGPAAKRHLCRLNARDGTRHHLNAALPSWAKIVGLWVFSI